MGQALYRTHRPKKLSEVVGQEHITQTLERALKQGRISHAYLLTGPRGVGKTSIARILAHEINKLPYRDDSSHIDIIEIDAASNRRIDEIRELREKVYVAPVSARYKVYIIDEVHMLTREAFNALLKTLEEPPAHVVFILATTDAHKLPETIVSRTQRFSFKPIEPAKVVDHLKAIAKSEKIIVSDEALQLLAEHGEGSFRDSISLLDQASNLSGKLEITDVQRLLGMPPAEALQQLLASLRGTSVDVMQHLTVLYDQGFQASAIAKAFAQALRSQLVSGASSLEPTTVLELLSQLIEVPASHDPERFLEIVLLRARSEGTGSPDTPAKIEPPDIHEAHTGAATAPVAHTAAKAAKLKTQTKTTVTPKKTVPTTTATNSTAELTEAIWPDVLAALKQRYNTLYGILRMAHPDFSAKGKLKLTFAFAFHQKQINETGNRQVLTDVIQELTGEAITIECKLDKNATPPTENVVAEPKSPAAASVAAISNIFGGGELLES